MLVAKLAIVVLSVAAYVGLAVLGWGGPAAFFAHPARVTLVLATLVMVVASLFTSGNLSKGEREDRGNRWVIAVLALIGHT